MARRIISPRKSYSLKFRYSQDSEEQYILKFCAARYFYNLGYRCIGFDVNIPPYGPVDVVASKSKNDPNIIIADCIVNAKEFVHKYKSLNKLKQKELAIGESLIEKSQANSLTEEELASNVSILRKIHEEMKCDTLYWSMIHAYTVANYHYIFGYDKVVKDFIVKHAPKEWGVVAIKKDILTDDTKSHKKRDAERIEIDARMPDHLVRMERKIAHSLTRDIIGKETLDIQHQKYIYALHAKLKDLESTYPIDDIVDVLEGEI